ncbi:MAG: hypothetical protein JWO97_4590 [Acidobacteria bacterium]|nr:hypothetical protein [Acidobacteriota bacterium]
MTSRADELTQRFLTWEMRGRGWQAWPHVVRLEPPFVPFYGHYLPVPPTPLDDGRRKGLLGRALDLFASGEPEEAPALPLAEEREPRPQRFKSNETVVTMPLILPHGTKIEASATEQFLKALTGVRAPVAFEIAADSERISVQLAARESDAAFVQESASTFFPACLVAGNAQELQDQWAEVEFMLALELALAREFMLPLTTFSRFDPDPLLAVYSALGDLESGEYALAQVLFEPARAAWGESALRALTDDEGKPFFADNPQLLRAGTQKVAQPLFAAVVRIAVGGAEDERITEIARHICGALTAFDEPDGNAFTLLKGAVATETLFADVFARTTHRSGMLLTAAELAGLVHPPSASVLSPRLLRNLARTKAAPAELTGLPFVLGMNEHAGGAAMVGLTEELRMRHMHVMGASGTGKSTFLLDLIMQTIHAGRGVGVIDPHGDLVDEVLAHIPDDRVKDIVLFDPSDTEHPFGFNLLAAHSDLEATLLASDLVAIFRRLSTSWGDQMNSVLANAIQAFLTSTTGGTLADLRRFLIEPAYREEFLKSVSDEEVVYYWTKEFPLLVGRPQAPILTRLDAFLRPKPLRAIFGARESSADFRSVMDGGRIFLAKLAQGLIGAENAALVGSLLVSKFQQAALSRQEIAAGSRREFMLVMDEFHELVTPSVVPILTGTRKFRLGLVASHHSLKQLQDADAAVSDALLANAATRIVFRVSDEDAKRLAEGFTSFDAAALRSLGVGEAICRVERADRDFNLRTRPAAAMPADVDVERRERAIAEWHRRHTPPRAAKARPREADAVKDDEFAAEDETPAEDLEDLYQRLARQPDDDAD